MKEGNVILTAVQQADGAVKSRPALVLRELPLYGDLLVCGISTQIHQAVAGFDELISHTDEDFIASGLAARSVIRLGFLAAVPRNKIAGIIGTISAHRHQRLLFKLSAYLLLRARKMPSAE